LISVKTKGNTFSAKAFAPGHITGFFEAYDNPDPIIKGSTGCGLVLNSGVETTVSIGEDIHETEITLNGKNAEGGTISTVVQMLTGVPIKVESSANIPVECGLGASGAGALSTAYAINSALSLNLTANKLNEIAHIAEVKNSSGLGDVAAQSIGGVVIRTSPGAPHIARHDVIPCPEIDVYCVVLGKLSTGSVLGSEQILSRINFAGRNAMKRLMQKPTVDNLMSCSRDFSVETGLANEKLIEIIEDVEDVGGLASQAMLGNTVFAIEQIAGNNEVAKILSKYGDVLQYKISSASVKVM
jgi:pantoate kinase